MPRKEEEASEAEETAMKCNELFSAAINLPQKKPMNKRLD